jgi:hypothetical protein
MLVRSIATKMEARSKIFFGVSLILSYLIITEGNHFFAWWMLIVLPIYAFWLTVPIFSSDEKFAGAFFCYIFWVAIQWLIYYYGLGPPRGMGIPGFY